MAKTAYLLALGLAAPLSACIITSSRSKDRDPECVDGASDSLLARSEVLWPMVGGTAEVRVCWDEPILESYYPLGELAPDLDATLAKHRQWTRDIAEAEWNGRTTLRFVGWEDCVPGTDDVRLVLIDSAVRAPCSGADGGSCVEALGTDLRGGSLFLNLFFGEEVLYSSRYQQGHPGGSYDPADDMAYWYIPQACLDEYRYAWSENNTLTAYPLDIDDPTVRAQFDAIYETCAKNITLHELGHAAGFAHEQFRDDPEVEACRELIEERGLGQDWLDPAERYLGDLPLGVFDAESIMSYCRTDQSATLTTTDVEATLLAYPAPPEDPEDPKDPNDPEDPKDPQDPGATSSSGACGG